MSRERSWQEIYDEWRQAMDRHVEKQLRAVGRVDRLRAVALAARDECPVCLDESLANLLPGDLEDEDE